MGLAQAELSYEKVIDMTFAIYRDEISRRIQKNAAMPEGERETMGEITDNSLKIAKMAVQKFAQDPDLKPGQS